MDEIVNELKEINRYLDMLNGNIEELNKTLNKFLTPIYDEELSNNNLLLIRQALQGINRQLGNK